jgi:hypothetical protein
VPAAQLQVRPRAQHPLHRDASTGRPGRGKSACIAPTYDSSVGAVGYDLPQLLVEQQMGLVGELIDELTYFR